MSQEQQTPDFVGAEFGVGVGSPPRPPIPLPAIDARTHAMRAFKCFIASLLFRRAGPSNQEPIEFKISPENIHIEMPDSVKDLVFPSVAFLPSRADYVPFGLGPPRIVEETADKFGEGTALLNQAEYTELFIVEVWGSKRGERRAIMAGLETAMMSFDDSWSVTLRLADHFGLTATFALVQRELIDNPDAVRNRRRGHIFIEATVCIVRLVNVAPFQPKAVTLVDVDC